MQDRLEEFLTFLSDPKKSPIEQLNLLNERPTLEEYKEKIELLFVYLGESYVATVWDAAQKKDTVQQEKIMENIMTLYPLSQGLVHHILREVSQSDGFLVRGADIGDKVYKALKNILKQMQSEKQLKGEKMTERFARYENDLNALDEEIKKLQQDSDKLQSYKIEKQKKETKKEQLEKETNPEERRKILEKLDNEIADLQAKKRAYEASEGEKLRFKEKLEKELKEEYDKIDNEKEKKLIRELLKEFPVDEGGDDA